MEVAASVIAFYGLGQLKLLVKSVYSNLEGVAASHFRVEHLGWCLGRAALRSLQF